MPTSKAHKTRHHSNLRPKHKHTKKYLQPYWPYLPLLTILIMIVSFLQPWRSSLVGPQVLPYATDVTMTTLLNKTNEERTRAGKDELALNNKLSNAAQAKAKDMVTRNYWSHNTPDGQAPWIFVTQVGYDYQKAGENLAYGFLSSQQVVTGWMNSASHRANILDEHYKEVGFGVADSANFDNNGPSTVVVAMYASPLDSPPLPAASEQTTPAVASFSSLSGTAQTPSPQTISRIQALTSGWAPWAPYFVGMIIGAALCYLAIKHTISIKRAFRKGERFVVHHPLFDVTLVALIVLGLVVIQRVGTIL